jgi:hypothetical protein
MSAHRADCYLSFRKLLTVNDLGEPGFRKPLIIKNLQEQTHRACHPLESGNL